MIDVRVLCARLIDVTKFGLRLYPQRDYGQGGIMIPCRYIFMTSIGLEVFWGPIFSYSCRYSARVIYTVDVANGKDPEALFEFCMASVPELSRFFIGATSDFVGKQIQVSFYRTFLTYLW